MADHDNGGGENREGDGHDQQQQQQSHSQTFISYMVQNAVDALLLITRIATVVFSILFIVPLAGNPSSFYQKALLSNAATSALRLHQRVPHFSLSREFVTSLFMEDSCHYLIYSLIFFNAFPITFVLVPVVLFAVMHSASFITKTYRTIGQPNAYLAVKLGVFVQQYQVTILRIIATVEIFLFSTVVLSILGGQMSILMPFVYYRFITLRYASRRNPYSRQMFYELRISMEQLACHQRCPAIISSIIHKFIGLICRMAPATQPAPAAQQ